MERVDANHALIDLLGRVDNELGHVAQALDRARAQGAVDHYAKVSWVAATQAYKDHEHRGEFAGVAVFNDNDFSIYVGFTPGGGTATNYRLLLPARAWISLPIRGTTVSVGAPSDGGALLVFFRESPVIAGGTLGAGTLSLGSQVVHVDDNASSLSVDTPPGISLAINDGGNSLTIDSPGIPITQIPASNFVTDSVVGGIYSGSVFVFDATLNGGAGGYAEKTIKRFFATVAASQTDASLIAAVTSKTLNITTITWMCGAIATTLVFNTKPAGAGTAISPTWPNGANAGAHKAVSPHGHYKTNSGEGFACTTGAGSSTAIDGNYFEN